MKKIQLFFSLLLGIAVCMGLTSCNDDDKDPGTTTISKIIIGEWDSEFLGTMSYDDIDNLDLNDNRITEHYMYFTFKSDGKGYDIYYNGDKTEWDWEIIDDVLYTSDGGVYDVIKFNKNVIYLLRNNSYAAVLKLVRR
ncbi:MAG: hypothetical protein K2M04_00630 [Muribaculaceae bacterium]|nr:hypothetical protein [Muribaculaceae bacterium]